MKKTVFLACCCITMLLFAVSARSASSLQAGGFTDTVTITPDYEGEFDMYAGVANISTKSVNVRLSMKFNAIRPFDSLSVCFGGLCYNTKIYADKDLPKTVSLDLEPGASSDPVTRLHVTSVNKTTLGITSVTYTFYVNGTPSDSVQFTSVFKVENPNDVREAVNPWLTTLIYPSPASDAVTIDHKFDRGTIEIVSADGRKTAEKTIQAGSNSETFNVADYADGTYFYAVRVDGAIKSTGKFQIKR